MTKKERLYASCMATVSLIIAVALSMFSEASYDAGLASIIQYSLFLSSLPFMFVFLVFSLSLVVTKQQK